MQEKLQNIESFVHECTGPSYRVAVLTSTALGAKEALVANLATEGDPVWTSPAGDFARLADALGIEAEPYDAGRRVEVATAVPTAVFVEHVTPQGALTNLSEVASRLRRDLPNVPLIADLSTSFGADEIDFGNIRAEGYVLTPERALGGIPGISVIAVTDTLLQQMRSARERMLRIPYALDVLKYCEKFKTYETPYSPDITAVVALDAAIGLIRHSGGLGSHIERHRACAKSARRYFASVGLAPVRIDDQTNAFTTIVLRRARDLGRRLAQKGVFVDVPSDSELRIGHGGHLTTEATTRVCEAFDELVRPTPRRRRSRFDAGPPLVAPRCARDEAIFTLPPSDFVDAAVQAARRKGGSDAYEQTIVRCATHVFGRETDFRQHSRYRDRWIGFVGAGNVAREAVSRCQALGISRISVYSPTLTTAASPSDDWRRRREYWESRGVRIVESAEELFFSCHTVVLLPTLHTRESVRLLGKTAAHVNEKLVSASLLDRVEKDGLMDALLNPSARGGLVDRKALAVHLQKGWLTYLSDELPAVDDPLLRLENACFTGHVGGSCPDTQKRVAENTHIILKQVLAQLKNGGRLECQTDGYALNVVNQHLTGSGNDAARAPQRGRFRILLTDPFDVDALDFRALEKSLHVELQIKDVSRDMLDEDALRRQIGSFRPHVIMLRSRTKLTRNVAEAAVREAPLSAVIRPGVGADNLYGAIETLSAAGVSMINEPFGNSYAVAEMTIHLLLHAVERVLLTPGPTAYHEPVFRVMDRYAAPSSAGFRAVERRIRTGLEKWIGVGGEVVLISGPATSLMEAAIVNLTEPGDRGLVIVHGKFGSRFVQIARCHRRAVEALVKEEPEWGTAFAPEDIVEYLRADAARNPDRRLTFLCLQQNETSSGVAYSQSDLERIARAARAYNQHIMIVIDAVSGTFAHDVNFRKVGADMVVLGSPKGLGVSSGYSYASLSRRALRFMLTAAGYEGSAASFLRSRRADEIARRFGQKRRAHYLNLLRLLLEGRGRRTDTPSVFHALSTDVSLRLLADEGRKAVIARHTQLAKSARSRAQSLGLKTLSKRPSNSVTTILLPDGVHAKDIRGELDRIWGLFVPGAQSDYWKPALLRIGHVGYTRASDVTRCMRALDMLLRSHRMRSC